MFVSLIIRVCFGQIWRKSNHCKLIFLSAFHSTFSIFGGKLKQNTYFLRTYEQHIFSFISAVVALINSARLFISRTAKRHQISVILQVFFGNFTGHFQAVVSIHNPRGYLLLYGSTNCIVA